MKAKQLLKEMLAERDERFNSMPPEVRKKAQKWEKDVSEYIDMAWKREGDKWADGRIEMWGKILLKDQGKIAKKGTKINIPIKGK